MKRNEFFIAFVLLEVFLIFFFQNKVLAILLAFAFVRIFLLFKYKGTSFLLEVILFGIWLQMNFKERKPEENVYMTWYTDSKKNLEYQKQKRVWYLTSLYVDSPYMPMGTRPIFHSSYAFNGYSAMSPKYAHEKYCLNWISLYYCNDYSMVNAKDPIFQKSLLELLGIEKVVISKVDFQRANVTFFKNQNIQSLSSDYLAVQNLDPISNLHITSNLKLEVKSFGEYNWIANFQKSEEEEAYIILPWIYSKNYKIQTNIGEVQKSFHNLVQIYIPKEITKGKIELTYEYPNSNLVVGIFLLAAILYLMGIWFYKKRVQENL